MPKKLDLVGKEFGWLVVQKKTDKRAKSGDVVWECLCKCGKISHVYGYNLRSGHTKSCGCYNRKLVSVTLKESWKSGKINDVLKFHDGTRIVQISSKNLYSNNTSGVRGVSWAKGKGKWQTHVTLKRKQIHLGYFDNKEEAIKARKRAEEIYFEPLIEKYG